MPTSEKKEIISSIAALLLVAFISLVVMTSSELALIFLIAVGLLAYSSLFCPANFKPFLKFALSFQGFFTLTSILTQVIVLGKISYAPLAVSNFRIFTLALLSFILSAKIPSHTLVKLFSSVSPSLGLSLVLALRYIRTLPVTFGLIYKLYRTNLTAKSRLRFYEHIIVSVKVFVNVVLYASLQTAEALATRSAMIFRKTANKELGDPF